MSFNFFYNSFFIFYKFIQIICKLILYIYIIKILSQLYRFYYSFKSIIPKDLLKKLFENLILVSIFNIQFFYFTILYSYNVKKKNKNYYRKYSFLVFTIIL